MHNRLEHSVNVAMRYKNAFYLYLLFRNVNPIPGYLMQLTKNSNLECIHYSPGASTLLNYSSCNKRMVVRFNKCVCSMFFHLIPR